MYLERVTGGGFWLAPDRIRVRKSRFYPGKTAENVLRLFFSLLVFSIILSALRVVNKLVYKLFTGFATYL